MAEPELVAYCSLAEPPSHKENEDVEAGSLLQNELVLVAIQVEQSSHTVVRCDETETGKTPSEDEDDLRPGGEGLESASRLLEDRGGGGDSGGGDQVVASPVVLVTDGARGATRSQPSSASRISSSVVSYLAVTSTRVAQRGGQLHTAGRDYCRRSLGLLVALLSGILMVAYSSMIKILEEMDSMQVVIIRGLLQMLIFGGIALFKRLSFRGEASRYTLLMLVIVSVTGGLRMMFIFVSFSRLPLGDSTAIIFSSPVFVMVLSVCVLKGRTAQLEVFLV